MIGESITVELGQVREIPQHIHSGTEIYLSLKGNINLVANGVNYLLRQDDIVLCNSGEVHGATGIIPNIILRVLISEEFLQQETGNANVYFHCNSCHMTEKERELAFGQLRVMLMQLMQLHYRGKEYMRIDFKSAALRIISFLYKHFQTEQKKISPQIYECKDERILEIISNINRNYNTDISLHKIAEEEHLSVHYMSRLFKKKTGFGFMEYLSQLRLAGAVNHLLHTDWPIIKIALVNGFSNVSSFNKLFIKQYGQSPTKYRAIRRVCSSPMDSEMSEIFTNGDELVRYLKTFDVRYKDNYSESVQVAVDTDVPVCKRLRRIGRIIRVGRMAELLKTEIRSQLQVTKTKILAEYAHFSCLHKDGIYKYKMYAYANYEYFQVLEFLHVLGVKPFFSFSVQAFIDETPDPGPEQWENEISAFLQNMTAHFSSAYTATWLFEIDYTPAISEDDLWAYYKAFYRAVRQTLPTVEIGVQFAEYKTNIDGDYALFIKYMKLAEQEGLKPTFITYYAGWRSLELFIENSENYASYKNPISMLIGTMAQHLRDNGMDVPKVLLMDWNVLTGFTSIESNAFFRSALYADGFLSIAPEITDVAYWINAYVHEAYSGNNNFEVPSLFLFDGLKRSVFFALIVLDQIYPDVIYYNDNIVVTKGGNGDLAILVMNACYFAPRLALDSAFTNSLRRIFSIKLENIRGEKIIERYHLDNERSSLYNRWASMGLPQFVDRNVIEQLHMTTNFDYSLFEEKIDGSYIFSVALNFNELALINIREKR